MSDPNAPVTKSLRAAHEHMAALQERREAAQALAAAHLAGGAQQAAQPPTDTETEAQP